MSELFDKASMYGFTENGAFTHTGTGSKVLDLFSMGGGLRDSDEDRIINIVKNAYKENPLQTVETLLYLRDIRGGQGEKRVFHIGMNAIRDNLKNIRPLIRAIVEVGSWKDVFTMFSPEEYLPTVKAYYNEHVKQNKFDLMEKWLPSIGGSKNRIAEKIAKYLELTPKQYRKYLSKARAQLNIVETKMCSDKWSDIEYDSIPSRAGFLYGEAFKRHDNERYVEHLTNCMNNTATVNAGTLYPYEITGKVSASLEEDLQLEAFWKNLPDYTDGSNSLVVADTSGSMCGRPFNVASSLAIYFAEHNKGIFHNEYVTFSSEARFIRFNEEDSLTKKVHQMLDEYICENTNLQSVFDLILRTGKEHNIPESEMPKNIYVISDMEFDIATRAGYGYHSTPYVTNFEEIERKYSESGYRMPKLIFWNVNSHQNNVPVTMNEDGVALVSGCSPSTFKMVITDDLNPYQFMLKTIESERYSTLAKDILKDN